MFTSTTSRKISGCERVAGEEGDRSLQRLTDSFADLAPAAAASHSATTLLRACARKTRYQHFSAVPAFAVPLQVR